MDFLMENIKLLLSLNEYEALTYHEAKNNPRQVDVMKEEMDSIKKMELGNQYEDQAIQPSLV